MNRIWIKCQSKLYSLRKRIENIAWSLKAWWYWTDPSKQCRSGSNHSFRSILIWIYTVCLAVLLLSLIIKWAIKSLNKHGVWRCLNSLINHQSVGIRQFGLTLKIPKVCQTLKKNMSANFDYSRVLVNISTTNSSVRITCPLQTNLWQQRVHHTQSCDKTRSCRWQIPSQWQVNNLRL